MQQQPQLESNHITWSIFYSVWGGFLLLPNMFQMSADTKTRIWACTHVFQTMSCNDIDKCSQRGFHTSSLLLNPTKWKLLAWAIAASLSARPNRKMRALSILTGTVRPLHSTSLMVAACLVLARVINDWEKKRKDFLTNKSLGVDK